MILAAGFGTRLRPLTNALPKPLLKISGRSLIEWNLLLLKQYGITEVIINLHYLGSQIEAALGGGSTLGMQISYSQEPTILGTGGGIKQAESFFLGQPFLVMNGDTLVDLDINALLTFHQQQGGIATMVIREDPNAQEWGPVEVADNGDVIRINGQGQEGIKAAGIYMFAGIHVIDPVLLQDVPSGQVSSIIDAYHRAIASRQKVAGFRFTGYWSDVGTVTRYEQAQQDVEAKRILLTQRSGLHRAERNG